MPINLKKNNFIIIRKPKSGCKILNLLSVNFLNYVKSLERTYYSKLFKKVPEKDIFNICKQVYGYK